MISRAPGKIIISGEHAVVYGKPALVMAINRYAEAKADTGIRNQVSVTLSTLGVETHLDIDGILQHRRLLYRHYNEFLAGERPIHGVLTGPVDLFWFAVGSFLAAFDPPMDTGLCMHLRSDIPIGSGMGSSASTVVSVLRCLAARFGIPFESDTFFDMALQAEKLQHGYPSGVDPYIAINGGFIRYQKKASQHLTPLEGPFYLINTGSPGTSTGMCVDQVARRFGDGGIWTEFEEVTDRLESALSTHTPGEIYSLIQQNHKLLCEIGVVPLQVQSFISDIEASGGAGKISGAGSVQGDQAGMVVVFSDTPPHELCKRYGYDLLPVKGDQLGARLISDSSARQTHAVR